MHEIVCFNPNVLNKYAWSIISSPIEVKIEIFDMLLILECKVGGIGAIAKNANNKQNIEIMFDPYTA